MTEPLPPPISQPSLGSLLTSLRQARGLSLEEVSQRLRFSVRQLQTLEAGKFDDLPDMAVVRAMTRAYGRFLEADVNVLVRQLELERPDAQRLAINASTVSVAPQGVASFTPNMSPTRRWVISALLILFLAALVVLLWHGAETPQQESNPSSPAPVIKEDAPALVTPAPAPGDAPTKGEIPTFREGSAGSINPVPTPATTVPAGIKPPTKTTPDSLHGSAKPSVTPGVNGGGSAQNPSALYGVPVRQQPAPDRRGPYGASTSPIHPGDTSPPFPTPDNRASPGVDQPMAKPAYPPEHVPSSPGTPTP